MNRDEVKKKVAESRKAQGLPPVVKDTATLARVVTLIKTGGDKS